MLTLSEDSVFQLTLRSFFLGSPVSKLWYRGSFEIVLGVGKNIGSSTSVFMIAFQAVNKTCPTGIL